MEIFDTQVHCWEAAPLLGRPQDVAHTDATRMGDAVSFEQQIYAMDAVGVDVAAINVINYRRLRTDGCYEYDNTYAEEASTRFPRRLYSIAWVDPRLPEIDAVIASVRSRPGVLAVRATFLDPSEWNALEAGKYDEFFASLAHHAVPLCVSIAGRAPLLEPYLVRHETLSIIIDHLGLKSPRSPSPYLEPVSSPFERLPPVLDLAQYPNVAVKWCAPKMSLQHYPFHDLWPHLHRLLEAFGPDRLMFASDWTASRGHHSYGEAVFYLRDTNELSSYEKEQIFSATARRILRCPR